MTQTTDCHGCEHAELSSTKLRPTCGNKEAPWRGLPLPTWIICPCRSTHPAKEPAR